MRTAMSPISERICFDGGLQRGYVAKHRRATNLGALPVSVARRCTKGVAGFLSHIDEGYAGSFAGRILREAAPMPLPPPVMSTVLSARSEYLGRPGSTFSRGFVISRTVTLPIHRFKEGSEEGAAERNENWSELEARHAEALGAPVPTRV